MSLGMGRSKEQEVRSKKRLELGTVRVYSRFCKRKSSALNLLDLRLTILVGGDAVDDYFYLRLPLTR